MNLKMLSVMMLPLVLAACSDSGSSGATAGAPSGKSESVFKAQTDALEKARQVDKITQDAAEKEKKQVEEQTH